MALTFIGKEKIADGCMWETPALKARGIVPLPDYTCGMMDSTHTLL